MRFLYVRSEFCPSRDLSTPEIRLSSDSASRWTPLPLASPSHCRVDSGLSPYRTCAHRAHQKKCIASPFRSSNALTKQKPLDPPTNKTCHIDTLLFLIEGGSSGTWEVNAKSGSEAHHDDYSVVISKYLSNIDRG